MVEQHIFTSVIKELNSPIAGSKGDRLNIGIYKALELSYHNKHAHRNTIHKL